MIRSDILYSLSSKRTRPEYTVVRIETCLAILAMLFKSVTAPSAFFGLQLSRVRQIIQVDSACSSRVVISLSLCRGFLDDGMAGIAGWLDVTVLNVPHTSSGSGLSFPGTISQCPLPLLLLCILLTLISVYHAQAEVGLCIVRTSLCFGTVGLLGESLWNRHPGSRLLQCHRSRSTSSDFATKKACLDSGRA